MNQVQIMGHATRDAETRYTTNKKGFASFCVAVSRGKPQEGRDEVSDFINVKVWETKNGYLPSVSKGDLVQVFGALHIDNYEKDGEKKQFVCVQANRVINLDEWRRKKNERSGHSQPTQEETLPGFEEEADMPDF